MDFNEVFEKLIMDLNAAKVVTPDTIREIAADVCEALRISKLMVSFYDNVKYEQSDRGDIYCCHDDGEDDSFIALRGRSLTNEMAVTVYTVYMRADAQPWSESEKRRVEMIAQLMIQQISSFRMKQQIEKLTFYDDDGYQNLRYYIRHIDRLGHENLLLGKAAIQFNLKHFSLVNQQIGRNAGTFVMRSFIKQLKKKLVGKGIVCRMGGDNFVVLCDAGELDMTLDYLSGTPVVYDVNSGDRINVSATSGVYVVPDDLEYDEPGDIMDKIIPAYTAAKSGDRGDVVFYSDEMIASKEKVMQIQQLIPIALKEGEFKVFYQPKIDVNTGEMIGAEALCRWFHDDKLIPPMEFIPILEQSTDICKLDFYMLDRVCRDIRRWLDEGKQVVRVSVNLSRKHMMDVDLLDHIIEIVDRNDVPHKYIEIELTETTTDVEFRDLKRVVNGLQQVGISTSVDDFGMGYSSLNLIKEVPWNVLKVDRSFLPVDDDDDNSIRSVMFKYVVAMAREMGLECIAEGVETQSQVEILRNNHCELAQGFFFDRPLPVNDFEVRMNMHKYEVK